MIRGILQAFRLDFLKIWFLVNRNKKANLTNLGRGIKENSDIVLDLSVSLSVPPVSTLIFPLGFNQ